MPRLPVRFVWLVWLVAMLLASAALVATLSVVPFLPTNDGAQHVLAGHVQAHYDDADAELYRAYLEPLPQFAEKGFAALFVPLEGALGWRGALRATLAIGLLGNAWGFAWLVRALAPGRWVVGLLGFAFAFAWPLYMGFFPFVVASAFGMAVVALAVQREVPGRYDAVALAALLGAQAALHAASAALTGVAVAGVVLARAPKGARVGALARLALAGVPAMGVVVAAAVAHAAPEAQGVTYPLLWMPLGERMRELPRLLFPGPAWRSAIGLAVIAIALVTAVARGRRGALSGAERGVAGVALVFLLLGALAPQQIPGWQFFSQRFLPLGAALAMSLVPVEAIARPALRRLAAVAIAAAAAVALLGTAALHRRLWSGCADTFSALDAPVRRAWFQLPVVLDPRCGVSADDGSSEVPHLAANLHAAELYAVAQGGLTPYLFAGDPSIDAFRYRRGDAAHPLPMRPGPTFWQAVGDARFRDDAAFHAGVLARLAGFGVVYEDVVVVGGAPADLDSFVARGYEVEHRQGSLLVARFRGCPTEVRIPRGAIDGPLTIDYGVVPVPEPRWSRTLAPTEVEGDGDRARVAIPRALCGDVWMRVRFGSSARACAGADEGGRVLASVRRSAVLACDPR